MRTTIKNQNETGSVDPLAQLVMDELRKSGIKVGFPTPEEMERLRAERAEGEFEAIKRRADRRERRLAELKENFRRKIRGETDHE
jgi:hypothetical protein